MLRTITIAIETHTEDNPFSISILEGESGYTHTIRNIPYEPHEHTEFNEQVGNEIYSWVIDAMEYDEAEKEDAENE